MRGRGTGHRVAVVFLLSICLLAMTGCRGSGEQGVGTELTDQAQPASAAAISAPQRIRALPSIDARAAARQVALMPSVVDHETAGRIALLADAFRLAIESDGGAHNHYLLVAGDGVDIESVDIDAHEFALRTLAPLGIIAIHDSKFIAWAPADIHEQVRSKRAQNDANAPPIRAPFPGTRWIASLVEISIETPDDDGDQLRGTITTESPDGRMARQGFRATRDGQRWMNVRLTGVRTEW